MLGYSAENGVDGGIAARGPGVRYQVPGVGAWEQSEGARQPGPWASPRPLGSAESLPLSPDIIPRPLAALQDVYVTKGVSDKCQCV